MNLLELTLKEEVEWPVGAEFAAQDGDDGVVYFYSIPPIKSEFSDRRWVSNGASYVGKKNVLSLSEDWSTRIITREEYQAAGGWMSIDFESQAQYFTIQIGKDGRCYRATNKNPAQLDNPEIESKFDPFVSVEDAKECKAEHAITPSKYTKKMRGVSVDVYDVLMAWEVANPALQHLIKKALQCGQRGHKDKQQDLQDIIDSAIRAKELERDA